jgi:hypothetical protein
MIKCALHPVYYTPNYILNLDYFIFTAIVILYFNFLTVFILNRNTWRKPTTLIWAQRLLTLFTRVRNESLTNELRGERTCSDDCAIQAPLRESWEVVSFKLRRRKYFVESITWHTFLDRYFLDRFKSLYSL